MGVKATCTEPKMLEFVLMRDDETFEKIKNKCLEYVSLGEGAQRNLKKVIASRSIQLQKTYAER